MSPSSEYEFRTAHTVRSYELDFMGHVNNAAYLRWLEQARLEAFESIGYPVEGLIAGRWTCTVARVEIDYRRETRFGDRVVVWTRVERVGRTSFVLRHRIEREGQPEEPVAEARVVAVWLDDDGRPTAVPDAVRRALREAGLAPPRLRGSAPGDRDERGA